MKKRQGRIQKSFLVVFNGLFRHPRGQSLHEIAHSVIHTFGFVEPVVFSSVSHVVAINVFERFKLK